MCGPDHCLICLFVVGSGKRALFEVISRRAQGPTRGQILLNGVPMSMRLFQVSYNVDLHSDQYLVVTIKIVKWLHKSISY